jgi:hypothetical protein
MAKSKRPRKRKGSRNRPQAEINPNAGGIDVGAREIYVAVPAERDAEPVRTFATFTADLVELAQWLKACGITAVAMEATSVYWMPLFTILEEHGIEVCLVNARHLKRVPGREGATGFGGANRSRIESNQMIIERIGHLSVEDLEGIEVYREGAFTPADLVQDACQAISIWTAR